MVTTPPDEINIVLEKKKGGARPPFGIQNLADILEQFHALDPRG